MSDDNEMNSEGEYSHISSEEVSVSDDWIVVEQNDFTITQQQKLMRDKYTKFIDTSIPEVCNDQTYTIVLQLLEDLVRIPRIWMYFDDNQTFIHLLDTLYQWLVHGTKQHQSISPTRSPPLNLVRVSQFQCVLHLHGDLIADHPGSALYHYFCKYLLISPFVRLEECTKSKDRSDSFEGLFDPFLFTSTIIKNVRHDFYGVIESSQRSKSPLSIQAEEQSQALVNVSPSADNCAKVQVKIAIESVLSMSELVLRDLLGSTKDSTMSDIITGILSNMLSDYLPEITSKLHQPLKDPEALNKDPRVILLKQCKTFTEDYYKALKELDKQGQENVRLDSQKNVFKIIEILVSNIEERGGDSVTKSIGIDKEILGGNPQALSAILDAVKSKIVSTLLRSLFPKTNQKVASAIAKVMEQCFDRFMEFVTNPTLWLIVLHRLPNLVLEMFPLVDIQKFFREQSSRPKKKRNCRKSSMQKECAVDLGLEVVGVITNLTHLCKPKGISGFFIRMGRHLLKFFVEDLGAQIINDLEHPVTPDKITLLCTFLTKLLWDENEVFIADQEMFKKLQSQIDNELRNSPQSTPESYPHLRITHDIRDVVMSNLTNLIRDIMQASFPKAVRRYVMPKSMTSLHALIWSILDVFVSISQSPELMEFVILQYVIYPIVVQSSELSEGKAEAAA